MAGSARHITKSASPRRIPVLSLVEGPVLSLPFTLSKVEEPVLSSSKEPVLSLKFTLSKVEGKERESELFSCIFKILARF